MHPQNLSYPNAFMNQINQLELGHKMKVISFLFLAWWVALSQSFPCFVKQIISHEAWKTYAKCTVCLYQLE